MTHHETYDDYPTVDGPTWSTYLVDLDPHGDVTLWKQVAGEPEVIAVQRTTHPVLWALALATWEPRDCWEATG